VLAEGLFTGHQGHDFHLRRLLAVVDVVDIDRDFGLTAGRLRQAAFGTGAGLQPSGVDAIVIAAAEARSAQEDVVVITSDVDDLTLLGSLCDHAAGLSVQPA
jgi:hypothetical protein